MLAALETLPHLPGKESAWDILRAEQESLTASPDVGTAAIDVMHRLLEAGHVDQARQLLELLDLASFPAVFDGSSGADGAPQSADAARPMAWARVAQARLLADSDREAAVRHLADAEHRSARSATPRRERAWAYWIAPEDLLARVRIERGLIDERLITGQRDLTRVLHPWEDHAERQLGSVDGERLASLCLRLRLRHGIMTTEEAQRWESADTHQSGQLPTSSVHDLVPRRRPTCSAHDLVPPLFVSVADAWLSAGQPERALALLEERLSRANEGHDDATVWPAAAGIASLARRVRLAGQRPLLAWLANPGEYRRRRAGCGSARLTTPGGPGR